MKKLILTRLMIACMHYISTEFSCPDLIDKLFDGAEQGKAVVIHFDFVSVSEQDLSHSQSYCNK